MKVKRKECGKSLHWRLAMPAAFPPWPGRLAEYSHKHTHTHTHTFTGAVCGWLVDNKLWSALLWITSASLKTGKKSLCLTGQRAWLSCSHRRGFLGLWLFPGIFHRNCSAPSWEVTTACWESNTGAMLHLWELVPTAPGAPGSSILPENCQEYHM